MQCSIVHQYSAPHRTVPQHLLFLFTPLLCVHFTPLPPPTSHFPPHSPLTTPPKPEILGGPFIFFSLSFGLLAWTRSRSRSQAAKRRPGPNVKEGARRVKGRILLAQVREAPRTRQKGHFIGPVNQSINQSINQPASQALIRLNKTDDTRGKTTRDDTRRSKTRENRRPTDTERKKKKKKQGQGREGVSFGRGFKTPFISTTATPNTTTYSSSLYRFASPSSSPVPASPPSLSPSLFAPNPGSSPPGPDCRRQTTCRHWGRRTQTPMPASPSKTLDDKPPSLLPSPRPANSRQLRTPRRPTSPRHIRPNSLLPALILSISLLIRRRQTQMSPTHRHARSRPTCPMVSAALDRALRGRRVAR